MPMLLRDPQAQTQNWQIFPAGDITGGLGNGKKTNPARTFMPI